MTNQRGDKGESGRDRGGEEEAVGKKAAVEAVGEAASGEAAGEKAAVEETAVEAAGRGSRGGGSGGEEEAAVEEVAVQGGGSSQFTGFKSSAHTPHRLIQIRKLRNLHTIIHKSMF